MIRNHINFKSKLIPITLSVIFTALFVFAGAKASYLTENLFVGSPTGGGNGNIWNQLILNQGKSADGVAFKIFNGSVGPTFFINGDGSFSAAGGKFAVDGGGNIKATSISVTTSASVGTPVYSITNGLCANSGSLTLNSTCQTVVCGNGGDSGGYPVYWPCSGYCGSNPSPSTCSNTLVGKLNP